MILCIDIGNSQLFGGVFSESKILLRFRHNTKEASSSDQIGIFLRSVLRENDIDPNKITAIAICSVVPWLDYSVRSACLKYFDCEPLFLQAGVKTGLRVCYRNPLEVGSDRIANAVAGRALFPDKNLIIIDFGTATTFCAVSKTGDYLGGVILAGVKLSMDALQSNTAKLFPVEIIRPGQTVGKSTAESIQSGLYYGNIGMIKEVTSNIKNECFNEDAVAVIATGGMSHLFEKEKLYDKHEPDLVLYGLRQVLKLNREL